jgi:D-alanyl-D-alanine dipeptidase
VLWAALGNGGIHPIYQSLVVQALHRRMIEQLEREQAQQRKLEDEARIDATRPAPSRKRSR